MKLRNKKTGEIAEFKIHKRIEDSEDGYQVYTPFTDNIEEWEDYEEPKIWWYLDVDGEVCESQDEDDMTKNMKVIGNYFETKEEAEKAVEKLKAWKRLKDKGFKFIGKTYETDKRFGSIFYKVDDDTYSEDIIDDLDLLFGGEE